jgi:hypothetical protein
MATLAQLSNDLTTRGREALATLLEEAPLIAYLEQYSAFTEDGTEFDHTPATGSQTVQSRALNDGYTGENVAYPNRQADELAFQGFELHIDVSIREDERRGLRGVDRYLDRHLPKKRKSFARGLQDLYMKGDSGANANEVDGLATIVDGATNLPGIGKTLTIDAADWVPGGAANHFDLTDETLQELFVQKLMMQIPYVPMANGLVMNHTLQGLLTTVMHRYHVRGEARNLFGEPTDAFQNKQIVGLRESAIGNDEPDGAAAAVTTSLYICTAGEGYVEVRTNSGLEYHDWDETDELDAKRANREICEVRSQPVVDDDEAILRIKNIKAA